MSESVSAKVPINIRWTQELVDDGKGGENFYVRLTPKIDRRGRNVSAKIDGLMTVVQRLKREKSNQLQRAAKYGMSQALKAEDFNKERKAKELAQYSHLAQLAKETKQENEMFGPQIHTARFEELMRQEAERRGETLNYAKEEKEDDTPEKEEIYYIK